jgi:ribosome-associated protein
MRNKKNTLNQSVELGNEMPNEEAEWNGPSRSQRKRDAEAMQKWGVLLVKQVDAAALKQFELPEEVYDAIVEGQRLTANGAIRRQMQYIGRLMSVLDPVMMQRKWDAFQDGSQVRKRYDLLLESWRERLLNDSNGLAVFMSEYPEADRDTFARLIPAARDELTKKVATPKAFRQLYRLLKVLIPFSLGE